MSEAERVEQMEWLIALRNQVTMAHLYVRAGAEGCARGLDRPGLHLQRMERMIAIRLKAL